MNNKEKYLPIGTVVMLKGGKKRLMVTGFCITPNGDKTKVFDYAGVIYPEGLITTDQTALFNHDQIEHIDFLGLIDEEEKQFKIKLKELIESGGVDSSSDIEIPKIVDVENNIETL